MGTTQNVRGGTRAAAASHSPTPSLRNKQTNNINTGRRRTQTPTPHTTLLSDTAPQRGTVLPHHSTDRSTVTYSQLPLHTQAPQWPQPTVGPPKRTAIERGTLTVLWGASGLQRPQTASEAIFGQNLTASMSVHPGKPANKSLIRFLKYLG